MTHKFTYKYSTGKSYITVEVDEDANIYEVIEAFEDYLKACGYAVDGKIYYDKKGEQ